MKDLEALRSKYDFAINESEITNQNLIEAKERIDGLLDSLKTSETNVRSLWRYKKKYLALQEEMSLCLYKSNHQTTNIT